MQKYFLKRLGLALIAIVIIITLVYFLIGLSPNKPISPEDYTTEAEYQAALRNLGLHLPIWNRFVIYVGDIFTGKGFGQIYRPSGARNIPDLFFGPLRYTLWITVPAFIVSAVAGISLGFVAGYKHGTWVDSFINIFVVFFMAVPSFLLAAFVLAFGDKLGLPIAFIKPEDGGYQLMILSLILPFSLITLTALAGYTYYTRNEVVTILQSNQVQIARSKGLDEWTVFKKHVLRNAAIPLLSILLPSYITMLAGSMVVETFFQVPGSSIVIINAVTNAEYNIIMFNTIFYTSLGLLTSIVVDILYVAIDPRIRYESASDFKFVTRLRAWKTRKNNLIAQQRKEVN